MSAMLHDAGGYDDCVSSWLSVQSWNCDELQSETLLLRVSLDGLPPDGALMMASSRLGDRALVLYPESPSDMWSPRS
jgi:hypothetical protein